MKKIMIGLMIGLIFVSSVYALGIATDYGSDYLKVPQGTQYKYSFRIQDMEDSPLSIKIELNDPSGIAKLVNERDEYIIQPKTTDTEFFIDISIPENVEIGEKYVIGYKVKTGSGGKGQITFGRGIGKEFTVEVVEKTEEVDEMKEKPKVFWVKGLTENLSNVFGNLTGNFAKVFRIESKVWLIGLALVLIAGIIGLMVWRKSR